MSLKWRYWHKRGYWQIWSLVPLNGIIDVPTRASHVQVADASIPDEAFGSQSPEFLEAMSQVQRT